MARLFKRRRSGPNGKVLESDLWYLDHMDELGIRRKVPLCRSETAAKLMMADILKRVELAKIGISDPYERHRTRPVPEHLREWHDSMVHSGGTEKHAGMQKARVLRVLKLALVGFLGEITSEKVLKALDHLGKANGLSIASLNHHLGATRAFCRWTVSTHRMQTNPMAGIKPRPGAENDQRHARRVFTDSEFAWLVKTTEAGPNRCGLSGKDRSMLYRLAVASGFRSKELAALTPRNFSPDMAIVKLSGRFTKNNKDAHQPVPEGLKRDLAVWFAGKAQGEPLWPRLIGPRAAGPRILKPDLETARLAWVADAQTPDERKHRETDPDFLRWEDSSGRFLDMHGLRHTAVSNWAKAGARPRELQLLARHCTAGFTLSRYVHPSLVDAARVVDQAFSSLLETDSSMRLESARKTGTGPESSGTIIGPNWTHKGTHNGENWGNILKLPETMDPTKNPKKIGKNAKGPIKSQFAGVAESADASDLKSDGR